LPSCPKSRIGFLVNPIAGMGGAVGLKGTDGLALEAASRGARPVAPERARSFFKLLAHDPDAGNLLFLTASGEMGEVLLSDFGFRYQIVYNSPEQSVAKDTRAACEELRDQDADLIVFCGGDGTARDVASSAGDIPILGIPAGVKMHSGVFAISPQAAAELTLAYGRGELKVRETEIIDVDEELYRQGELQTKLYATAKTPYKPVLVQERKRIYSSRSEEEFKDQIAHFAMEFMRDGSAYILGAGTTTAKIAELMGIEKTLLGVDVIQDGRVVVKDASERDLLDLLDRVKRAMIIVSPIGAQGFILGRGSQQISPQVLRRTGIKNLIVVATPHKLEEIDSLLVDTSDSMLDRELSGRRQVVTGYRIAQLKDVRAASNI